MLLVWWYTGGLLALLHQVRDHTRSLAYSLNLNVMTRYLFVPMYGYYDFWSRVISFCVRIVQLVGGLIVTIIYIILELILIIAWIAVPIIVIANIFYQIFGYLW